MVYQTLMAWKWYTTSMLADDALLPGYHVIQFSFNIFLLVNWTCIQFICALSHKLDQKEKKLKHHDFIPASLKRTTNLGTIWTNKNNSKMHLGLHLGFLSWEAMHIHACVYTHMHEHTRMNTRTRAHTHTHTHTQCKYRLSTIIFVLTGIICLEGEDRQQNNKLELMICKLCNFSLSLG